MTRSASLWELVEWRAAGSPDAEMLVDERGRRVSFGRFRCRAERVPAGLAARGELPRTSTGKVRKDDLRARFTVECG